MPQRRASRVTLSAVAEQAGVALSTASIILAENSAYFRNFSGTTVSRVRQTAQRLGYRPSLFASSLPAKGASLFFLVALHDLNRASATDRFFWGFDGDLQGGVLETALEHRVYPIVALCKAGSTESDVENVDRIVGGGAFGALVRSPSSALEKRLRQYIRDSRLVVVIFPNSISRWPTNALDVDNIAMGEEAGSLLARQSRGRWLIMMDPENGESHALRLRGFERIAKQQGAKLQVVPCPQQIDVFQASALIAPYLGRSGADGIFALSSHMAEGVLHACEQTGREVGRDLLLVGCDCSIWSSPRLPRITSLEASWREAGQVAMRTLLEMRDQGDSRCPTVLLKPILIPGETCPGEGQ